MKPSTSSKKFTKWGVGLTASALILAGVSGAAVATQAAATQPATSSTGSGLGLWTGKDGDCNWNYDLVTKTLTISGPKGSQLSSTPLAQELPWHYNVNHIVINGPVKLPVNAKGKFANFEYLQDIKGMGQVDTSATTNMAGLFEKDEFLTSVDTSDFDTSHVTDMSKMFSQTAINNLALANFDTRTVTNMSGMFAGTKTPQLDLTHFDTINVTDMSNMFMNAAAQALDVAGFKTGKVTNMSGMFQGAAASRLDVGSFDTSKVTNMSNMFSRMGNLTSLDLHNFDTHNVTTMDSMFADDSALTNVNLKGWDTSKVKRMYSLFENDPSLVKVDLHHFKTDNLTEADRMFRNDPNLKTVNLRGWNTRKLTGTSEMFKNCTSLVKVNLKGWHTPKLIDSTQMFRNTPQLAGVDLGHFNIHNSRIVQQAGNRKGLAVKLGHYRLRKSSGIGQGFKHIQAVGSGTIRNPRGARYTAKQLFKLYNHSAKKSPLETYVMYNGKKPRFPKGFNLR
ncbi:BspA family leucine-rich repeat surface protein [Lactobacillus sp. XV13L]|nr:BspA family leucine-rich repeat surface protein [Lactobacillus sp. XV13L]